MNQEYKNKYIFLLFVLIIIVIGIYLRIQLLQNNGFFEPDGFYHFAVIRAAVNNNFQIPKILSLSGAPNNPEITEPYGLYWVTLIPYFFLRFFGFSYYDVYRLIPVLFGILDIIGAYYLSRFLSKNKIFGLLVMLFVAVSLGNVSKTMATVYRGDAFVSIFLIISFIFMLKIFQEKLFYKKIIYGILSGFFLSLCSLVWNGSSFAVITYIISILVVSCFGYVLKRDNLFKNVPYMLFSLFVWFCFAGIYQIFSFIKSSNQALLGISFIIIYILTLAFFAILYIINYFDIFKSNKLRMIFLLSMIILGYIFILIFFQVLINRIFIYNGFADSNSLFSSINELLPPTYNFALVSFGITIFFTPMSFLITLGTIFQNYGYLFWFISIIGFIPFFFIKINKDGYWLDTDVEIKENITPQILVLIAYFTITSYLVISGIRFSSLFSIPLAIFSAYGVYWIFASIIKKNIEKLGTESKKYLIAPFMLLFFLLAIIIIMSFAYVKISPADGITNQTLNGMSWISNNTPSNSIFLTLWTDGSLIEGWGNRTSVIDSVGSQNEIKINNFNEWLINDTGNNNIFFNSTMGTPNYLLVRNYWINYIYGIYLEAEKNISNYYIMNKEYIETGFSGTIYNFTNLYYNFYVNIYVKNQTAPINTSEITIGDKNSKLALNKVLFYDYFNGNFSEINYTNNGYDVIVLYNNTYIKNTPVNEAPIGVYLLNKTIFNSNLIKSMFMCNLQSCSINNKEVMFKLAYMNTDMKIFKINRNVS